MKLYPYQQAILDRLLKSDVPMVVQFGRRFGMATVRAELERTLKKLPPIEVRPLSSFKGVAGHSPALVVTDEIIGGNRRPPTRRQLRRAKRRAKA